MRTVGLVIGLVAALFAGAAPAARAAEPAGIALHLEPTPPAAELSIVSKTGLGIGYQSPSSGSWSLGAPLMGRRPIGGLGVASVQDVSARFSTHVLGGDIGFFGSYADQPNMLALSPTASWNFGATVGYAGVYVLGGVSDTASFGPFVGREGWAAGLGYDMGAFDLRLTYATSAASTAALAVVGDGPNRQQITLGGMYRLGSGFFLNADAFYTGRERGAAYLTAPEANALQGTGARVGVQLRF